MMESHSGADFLETLQKIGYKGKNLKSTSFDQLFDNGTLLPFLAWFCQDVGSSNALLPEQLKEYEEMELAGEVLYGEELELALKNVSATDETRDEDDVEELRKNGFEAKSQLAMLDGIHAGLVSQKTILNNQISKLESLNVEIGHSLDQSQGECLESNTSLNTVVGKLQLNIKTCGSVLRSFHNTESKPEFFSQISLAFYKEISDNFDSNLKLFMSKQFEQHAAILAGQEDDVEYRLFELPYPGIDLVKGPEAEKYKEQCSELSRLRHCYYLAEVERITFLAEDQAVKQGIDNIKRLLKEVEEGTFPTASAELSFQVAELHNRLRNLRSAVKDIKHTSLPKAACASSELQASYVITDDYDLKLQRQNYYLEKMEVVWDCLTTKRLLADLVWMILDNEKTLLQDLADLLHLSDTFLREESADFSTRMGEMEKCEREGLLRNEFNLSSLVPLLKSVNSLLLGKSSTCNSLCDIGLQLSTKVENLEQELFVTSFHNHWTRFDVMEKNLKLLEQVLFSGSTRKPITAPLDVSRQIHQSVCKISHLQEVLLQLEYSYKKAENVKKYKYITTSKLLWILFLLDPIKLQEHVLELENEVNHPATERRFLQSSRNLS